MYLVAHRESSVVSCRSPEVGNVGDVDKIDEIKPSVKNEPSRLPMIWDKVRVVSFRKSKRVQEEEAKDDDDAGQDAPPQLLVHHCLDVLFSLEQIFHGEG